MPKHQKVQEAHTNDLLKKQGVTGTAVGEKWVNGKPTGKEAILVFVQKKFSAKSIANPNVLTKFSAKDLFKPFRSLQKQGSKMAVLAALCTSLYSLIDKKGVTIVDPLVYAFWFDMFLAAFLCPLTLSQIKLDAIKEEWKQSRGAVIIAGFVQRVGYLLALFVMSLTPVSYVVSIRQLSIPIGTLFGIVLLREKHGRMRLFGAIIIFIGIVMLGFVA